MATTETPNKTTAKPKASGAAAPPRPLSKTTAPSAPQPTLSQRLLGLVRSPGAAASTNGAKAATAPTQSNSSTLPPGYWRKFFQGSLIFVGGSYIIILALTYLSARFPQLGLNGYVQPPHANVLVLSGLTWENLIFLVAIIGLWAAVQKLGLMPRPQPYTPQPGRGASGASGSSGAKGGSLSANALPGIGERRTRTERRHLAAVAAEKEAQKAAAAAAKNKTRAKAAAADVAPVATKTARVATTKAPAVTVAAPKTIAGDHDEMYERVKADQRLRRRREAKR